jgi:hypothetical protein
MREAMPVLMRAVYSLAFVMLVAGAEAAVAQGVLTGDWTASTKTEESDKINLSFERRTERGGRSQMGSTYAYADLQGLSRAGVRWVRPTLTPTCRV